MISRIYVVPKNLQTQNTKADSYLIDAKLSKVELVKLAEALVNPILENYYINTPIKLPQQDKSARPHGGFSYAVEIGYLPGVTDNVGHTVKEIASDLLHLNKDVTFQVYTSKIFFISGSKIEVEKATQSFYNPLIERASIVEIKSGEIDFPNKVPKVELLKRKPVINVSLNIPDEELIKIGKEGILDPSGIRRGPLAHMDRVQHRTFIQNLKVSDKVRKELLKITPENYIGLAPKLASS